MSSWYVDGTSTTLALSAPDGWTNVLLGTLLAAARTKALLFAACKDDRRRVDSMMIVLVAVCRMDDRDEWDWITRRNGGRTLRRSVTFSDPARGSDGRVPSDRCGRYLITLSLLSRATHRQRRVVRLVFKLDPAMATFCASAKIDHLISWVVTCNGKETECVV